MHQQKVRIPFDHSNFDYLNNQVSSKNKSKHCFIIIKPNQGGLESKDFCTIISRMIEKYCLKKNIIFKYVEKTDYIIKIQINSESKNFMDLSGLHKLVRVSPFGKGDKLHTSLCKVNVVDPKEEFEIQINEKDVRIDYYKSTGPGGQHKNKTMSAVRILHLPTNVMVTSDGSRSQHDNREEAFDLLKNKLSEIWNEKLEENKSNLRMNEKNNEKITVTYYFNHKMAINEKTNKKTHSLKNLLNGDIDEIMN